MMGRIDPLSVLGLRCSQRPSPVLWCICNTCVSSPLHLWLSLKPGVQVGEAAHCLKSLTEMPTSGGMRPTLWRAIFLFVLPSQNEYFNTEPPCRANSQGAGLGGVFIAQNPARCAQAKWFADIAMNWGVECRMGQAEMPHSPIYIS